MYKGSNAEKLHNMCLYDLLCRMNDNIGNMLKEETVCILEAVTGKCESCRANVCRECLQKWLNEEAE